MNTKNLTTIGLTKIGLSKIGLAMIGLILVLTSLSVTVALAFDADDLATVRAATAQYHRPAAAQAAGWGLVPGLDYCFNKPGVGAMGYHYINVGILDLNVELLQPEAMVYAPGPDGLLQLGAVEYIVPAAPWDAAGNTQPPTLLGKSFHLNQALGVYVLHAWIWRNNPAGMFEDYNPEVACP